MANDKQEDGMKKTFLEWILELKDVAWGKYAIRLGDIDYERYWKAFYVGGYTPTQAIDEDMSYDAGK